MNDTYAQLQNRAAEIMQAEAERLGVSGCAAVLIWDANQGAPTTWQPTIKVHNRFFVCPSCTKPHGCNYAAGAFTALATMVRTKQPVQGKTFGCENPQDCGAIMEIPGKDLWVMAAFDGDQACHNCQIAEVGLELMRAEIMGDVWVWNIFTAAGHDESFQFVYAHGATLEASSNTAMRLSCDGDIRVYLGQCMRKDLWREGTVHVAQWHRVKDMRIGEDEGPKDIALTFDENTEFGPEA